MSKERIEIQLIHEPTINVEDNSYGVNVLINNESVFPTELSQEQMLHIGAILLNASRKFINNADKTKD